LGSVDYPFADDITDVKPKKKKSMPNYYGKDSFAKRMKKYKNIKRFDYSALKFKDYVFIGMRGAFSSWKS